eukprot:473313-Prymnesium_polylepis.1
MAGGDGDVREGAGGRDLHAPGRQEEPGARRPTCHLMRGTWHTCTHQMAHIRRPNTPPPRRPNTPPPRPPNTPPPRPPNMAGPRRVGPGDHLVARLAPRQPEALGQRRGSLTHQGYHHAA